MPMSRPLVIVVLALLVGACSDPPPPGRDLVRVSCTCFDGCAGGSLLPIDGAVCTDGSVPANVEQAKEFLCEGKETTGFNVCKIENCSPNFASTAAGGCPENDGDFSTGDFGQSTSVAVPPSSVAISGDDINDFSIAPETFQVSTTQTGSSLFFGQISATLATTVFTSDGIFGDDEHTLAEGQLLASPFTVDLEPDGSFLVPPGAGNFIITGLIDGDRLSLRVNSIDLGGQYDEELGIFTLIGTVQAEGADLTIDADLVLAFVNRPPRAAAGADQVVECDSTQETASVELSGSQSTDPDGDDDLAVFTWYVDGAEAASGEQVDVPIGLGQHGVTLIVADQLGSFDGDTLSVSVGDTLPPDVTIADPKPINYPHSETVILSYTVSDVCTGVASVTALMDGATTLAGHGLASGQPINLLTELGLGAHTFRVETVDDVGNQSSASVTFVIVVTPASIQAAVRQFLDAGAIASASDGTNLLRRLANAARSYAAGNCQAAAGAYGSFINAVEAQKGKGIDPAAADILILDARFLIEHCPDVLA